MLELVLEPELELVPVPVLELEPVPELEPVLVLVLVPHNRPQ